MSQPMQRVCAQPMQRVCVGPVCTVRGWNTVCEIQKLCTEALYCVIAASLFISKDILAGQSTTEGWLEGWTVEARKIRGCKM